MKRKQKRRRKLETCEVVTSQDVLVVINVMHEINWQDLSIDLWPQRADNKLEIKGLEPQRAGGVPETVSLLSCR